MPTSGGLYSALTSRRPEELPDYLLGHALGIAQRLMAPVEPYGRRSSTERPYEVQTADLWEWYALSRINDYLIYPFQGGRNSQHVRPSQHLLAYEAAEDITPGATKLAADVYLQFFNTLGFLAIDNRPFSPFHHEIAEVSEPIGGSDDIEIDQVFWPGLMFGDLLFSRAGVRGHNSQWRTSFRRDYDDGRMQYFNVDGHRDITARGAVSQPGLLPTGRSADADLPMDVDGNCSYTAASFTVR